MVFLLGSWYCGTGKYNIFRINRIANQESETGNVGAEAKRQQETHVRKRQTKVRNWYKIRKHPVLLVFCRFNLYVKLLFAMGVNWSMEVISWLVNWNTKNEYQYIWYATDFFNAVYGVFIFFIFVFKKKIWTLLQRR